MSLVTDGHRRRADAILRRRTDRLPFATPANWESFEPVLRNAFDAGAGHLDVIADGCATTGRRMTTYRIAATIRFFVSD